MKAKLLSVFAGLTLMFLFALAISPDLALAQQGPEIPITETLSYGDQPDVATDSNGNIHIVYSDSYGLSYREIWYTMLDNDGNTLIDDTVITEDDSDNSVRPTVEIDSDDKVQIVWQDLGGYAISYTKLDPYLDDMNGDAANPETITLVDDTILYEEGYYHQSPRLAIDSDDDIHIVWEDYNYYNIFYMKVNDVGGILVAATVIRDASSIWRAGPDVATDSNDDVHVTWNESSDTSENEIYYMMLHGSNGSALIDATLMTPDDGYRSKGQSIVIDCDDMVHLFWKDQRGDGQSVYHTKLDPALDDQNGDPADEPTITLIDDTRLTADNGNFWVKRIASATVCGENIHLSYWEYYTEDLFYSILGAEGDAILPQRRLTTTGSFSTTTDWTVPYLDLDSDGRAHIVWCADRSGYSEVYYTYCDPDFPTDNSIRVTDCETRADQPDVAVDSNGNSHIVYFDECGSESREIWYTMLDDEGNTLIDDTQLTEDDQSDKHPAVVVDSDDNVLVVWSNRATAEIVFTKLDPSLDDQDGDPASPAMITVVEMTELTEDVDSYLTHPRMVLDSNDDIHVVFEEDGYEVYYLQADNEGNVLIPTVHIRECSSWYGRPDVAVDSNDDVHIVWNDYNATVSDEVYYMMLDGFNSNTLIDATLITPDDGYRSKRQTIQIDSEDLVYIIWHDQRGSDTEIYFSKLDPGLDDQNGDSADEATITLIDDTALTADDSIKSKNPQTAINDDNIYISYYQDTDAGIDVFFMLIDTNGDEIVPATAITQVGQVTYSTSYGDNAPNMDVDSEGAAHIVWCDGRDGAYEIYFNGYTYPDAIVHNGGIIPADFSLKQNYPNPFNPSTTIGYDLVNPTHVILELFNLRGQLVSKLVDEQQLSGSYLVDFNAGHLASGVYFYRLRAGDRVATRKMMLLR